MKIIIGIFLLLFFGYSGKSYCQNDNSVILSKNIPTASPSELGIDTLLLNDLIRKINEQFYPNIHSILIAKDGKLIYEEYFAGNDQNYGKDIGLINHNKTTLHDLRSITKSIVSACIGIAIMKGLIKNINQKVSDFFPEIEFHGKKAYWTIEHFLTMTTGLVWNENIPYNNLENDEIKMTYSSEPVIYVLSKQLDTIPGTKFNYNGGATQVLAEIVERSSKSTIYEFAKENIFKPLDVRDTEWNKYSIWGGADKFAAPSGLRLSSIALMKIGLLYRNNGKWNEQEIISPEWVKESFTQKIEFPSTLSEGNDGYGYQFWMWPDKILEKKIKIVAAIGNGDQNIYWDLKNDLVVVTTAGNYNKLSIENNAYSILKNHIYPAIGIIE